MTLWHIRLCDILHTWGFIILKSFFWWGQTQPCWRNVKKNTYFVFCILIFYNLASFDRSSTTLTHKHGWRKQYFNERIKWSYIIRISYDKPVIGGTWIKAHFFNYGNHGATRIEPISDVALTAQSTARSWHTHTWDLEIMDEVKQ